MTYMSDDEIKQRYQNMDDTIDREQVLADLNDCSKRDIVNILNGVDVDITKPKRDQLFSETVGYIIKKDPIKNARAIKMLQYGCALTYVSRKLGISHTLISRWKEKNGIKKEGARLSPNDYNKLIKEWDAMIEKGLL